MSGLPAEGLKTQADVASKSLECDDCMRVDDVGNCLYFRADEMPDVNAVINVEFGQNIKMAGNGINLRSDFTICQTACDIIGLAELAFDLNKKSFHRFMLSVIAFSDKFSA